MRARGLVAALAVLPIVAAAGCSTGGSGGGDSHTLKMSALATDRAAVDKYVKEFEKENPGTTVNVTYASSTDQYNQTLKTQLYAGTGPDVLYVYPGGGSAGSVQELAKNGYLADLSDQAFAKADMPKLVRSSGQYDGKQYMIPMSFQGIGAIFNMAALQKLGASAPTTWSQLLDLCKQAKSNGTVAFALGNLTPWVTQIVDYALTSTLVYGPQPDFAKQHKAGHASFVSSPGWNQALQKYLQMNDAGCFNANPNGTDVDTARAMVVKGQALGLVQPTNSLGALKAADPSGDFRVFALPATDNAADTYMPGAPGTGVGINKKTGSMSLALKFEKFLMEDSTRAGWAAAVGALPAVPTHAFTTPPALEQLQKFLDAGKTTVYPDQNWPNATVQQTHLTGIQELFSGQTTPAKLLAAMDKSYSGS